MNIVELFEKVLEDSSYAGEYNFGDLIGEIEENKYNALATQTKGNRTNIIVFVNGEGEGAIQIDESGMIYGDKVLYSIDKKGSFKLFLIEKKLAESITARCRIYEKSHLMDNNKTLDLPEITKFSVKPARCTITVSHNNEPVEGVRVKIMRIGESGVFDTTSKKGTVSFILQKGKYDCIISDKDKKDYKYKIVLPGKDAYIDLEI